MSITSLKRPGRYADADIAIDALSALPVIGVYYISVITLCNPVYFIEGIGNVFNYQGHIAVVDDHTVYSRCGNRAAAAFGILSLCTGSNGKIIRRYRSCDSIIVFVLVVSCLLFGCFAGARKNCSKGRKLIKQIFFSFDTLPLNSPDD
jgi:hypothetical protein